MRQQTMKIITLLAILITFSISGCETMEGLGKDIQNLGDSIEKKASDDE